MTDAPATSRWKRRSLVALALLMGAYVVLLVPDGEDTPPVPASGDPFVWDQNDVWQRLQQRFEGQRQRPPAEVVYDWLLQREGRQLVYMPLVNYADYDCEVIREFLEHPSTVLSLSDGGAHVGLVCDVSVPTYMITYWARDRRRGPRIDLERVVKMQTSETARLYGLHDRGEIAVGKKGDLNLIDLERLHLHAPEMVFDLPCNGKRFIQRADGYVATIVSGQVTFENGEATGALPGKILRGPQLSAS